MNNRDNTLKMEKKVWITQDDQSGDIVLESTFEERVVEVLESLFSTQALLPVIEY